MLSVSLGLTACGGDKPADKSAKSGEPPKAAAKTEDKAKAPEAKAPEAKKTAEPTALGDYEMKCTEPVAVTNLVFDGAKIDTKGFTKSYAFSVGGKEQNVYIANFDADVKMLQSGNIDIKKLQANQFVVKLIYRRNDNKAGKELITTISPYKRVINRDANSTDEGSLLAYVYTKDKAYGNRFLGDGMLTGVTTKMVCGKAAMKGESTEAEKYMLELTFNAANKVL